MGKGQGKGKQIKYGAHIIQFPHEGKAFALFVLCCLIDLSSITIMVPPFPSLMRKKERKEKYIYIYGKDNLSYSSIIFFFFTPFSFISHTYNLTLKSDISFTLLSRATLSQIYCTRDFKERKKAIRDMGLASFISVIVLTTLVDVYVNYQLLNVCNIKIVYFTSLIFKKKKKKVIYLNCFRREKETKNVF